MRFRERAYEASKKHCGSGRILCSATRVCLTGRGDGALQATALQDGRTPAVCVLSQGEASARAVVSLATAKLTCTPALDCIRVVQQKIQVKM